jgi:hypothetical protein
MSSLRYATLGRIALASVERMNATEARNRIEAAVDQILLLPAGMAELGFAMFVVDRSDEHSVGRREALKLFNARLEQLDAESQGDDAGKRAVASLAMQEMVSAIEGAGRGEYRLRDARA